MRESTFEPVSLRKRDHLTGRMPTLSPEYEGYTLIEHNFLYITLYIYIYILIRTFVVNHQVYNVKTIQTYQRIQRRDDRPVPPLHKRAAEYTQATMVVYRTEDLRKRSNTASEEQQENDDHSFCGNHEVKTAYRKLQESTGSNQRWPEVSPFIRIYRNIKRLTDDSYSKNRPMTATAVVTFHSSTVP